MSLRNYLARRYGAELFLPDAAAASALAHMDEVVAYYRELEVSRATPTANRVAPRVNAAGTAPTLQAAPPCEQQKSARTAGTVGRTTTRRTRDNCTVYPGRGDDLG